MLLLACLFYIILGEDNVDNSFLDYSNVNSARLYCKGGSGCFNTYMAAFSEYLLGDLCISSTQTRKSTQNFCESTIRDVCFNAFYGIILDSQYQIWVYNFIDNTKKRSFEDENNYRDEFTKVNYQFVGKPKKLACTITSMFVLTFDDKLYGMGGGYNNELSDTFEKIRNDFILLDDDVFEIEASEQTIYWLKQPTEMIEIWSSGYNNIDDNIFKTRLNTDNLCEVCHFIRPRIQAFHKGLLISFKIVEEIDDSKKRKKVGYLSERVLHYFQGTFHPSTKRNEYHLVLIDFSSFINTRRENDFSVNGDHFTNAHPIDFINRLINGCGFIVSGNRILFWGYSCVLYDTISNGLVRELTNEQYGNYNSTNMEIVNFQCSISCFILTEKTVFIFDPESSEIISEYSDKLMFIIPSKGVSTVYGFIKSLSSTGEYFVHHHDIVNEYQPMINRDNSGSGFPGNQFRIEVIKPHVFKQTIPTIRIGNTENEQCMFEVGSAKSLWGYFQEDLFIENVYESFIAPYDIYLAEGYWKNFTQCDWEMIEGYGSLEGFVIYKNRVFVEEKFFTKYTRSFLTYDTEQYYLDIDVLFKNEIFFDIDVDVQKKPLKHGVKWEVHQKIINKEFNWLELIVQVQTETPIRLKALKKLFYTATNFFEKMEISEIENQRMCDDLHCYQQFKIYFVYGDSCIINTVIDVELGYDCHDDIGYSPFPHPNCEESGISDIAYVIQVNVLSEDVCVVVQETVDLLGSYKIFKSWKFNDKSLYKFVDFDGLEYTPNMVAFYVGDYVYFEFAIKVVDNLIDVYRTKLSSLVFNEKLLLNGDDEVTNDGYKANFNLEICTDPNKVRFSFKIIEDHVNLKYGDSGKNYSITVLINVDYLGYNNRRKMYSLPFKKSIRGMKGMIGILPKKPISISAIVITSVSVLSVVGMIVIFCMCVIFCISLFKRMENQRKRNLVLKE